MSRIIPVPLPDLNKLPSPSETPKDLTSNDIAETNLQPQAPGSPTLLSDITNKPSNETLPPTTPEKPHSDPLALLFDVDADKENIPPVETGLLLSAPLICDEELSKTIATPSLAFDFEQLGVSSEDEEDSKSDSEEGAGEGDESSSGGEEEEPPLKRPPQVLSVLLDHRERLALKRRISASTLSCKTDHTSEFSSRCNSPTRSVMRPRTSAGSTLSRIIGRLTEDCTQSEQASSFRDWKDARSATPVGAILPLPLQETLGIETLLVTESPRPLAHPELEELSAEASAAVLLALDAAAAPEVNEVKTEETPLAGSGDFPIELLPDPTWGESGVDRVG